MRMLALLLMLMAGPALAAPLYSVVWEQGQRGTFAEAECAKGKTAEQQDNEESKVFDFCACHADIVYPQLSGLANASAQSAINADLKALTKDKGCETKTPYKPLEGRTGSRRNLYFDVKQANDKLISFLIWNDEYGAGAAHNSWGLTGVTFDLATGRKLFPRDLVEEKQLPALNQRIRDELRKGNFGREAKAQLEKRSADFLMADGCAGCAYFLTREGMEIVFQLYEVASFAQGNPKVVIGWQDLKETIRNLIIPG